MGKPAFLFWIFIFLSSSLLASNPPRFAPAKQYTAGSDTTQVAIGDLNNDGHPDIVAIDKTDKTVSVLLNQGDGTMLAAVPYSLGPIGTSWPNSVVVADFNHDNKLDVAVTTAVNGTDGGSVLVLLGNGDGTLQPPISYPTNISPLSLAVADINRDGNADLLVGGSGLPAILFGNGDGTFGAPVTAALTLDVNVTSLPVLTAADVNGDGIPDIVAGVGPQTWVSVYLGRGDGSFSAPVTYKTPFLLHTGVCRVVLQDVNGDSKPDILAISDAASIVFLGNGDGTFANAVLIPGGPYATGIVVGDFNGDGLADDIAVSNINPSSPPASSPSGFGATVAVGLGNNNLFDYSSPVQIGLGSSATSIAVSDLNGDKLPDLVLADRGKISVFLNGANTTVTLTGSPNPQPPGQNVTLTAKVAPAEGALPTPTGTVTFVAGGPGLEPGYALGSTSLDSTGTATMIAPPFTSADVIQVEYSGDTNYIGSNAAPLILLVGYPTQTSLTASASTALVGTTINFTAVVSSSTSATATGTVQFLEGTTVLGAATLINGSAQFGTSSLSLGAHTIIANYIPDSTASGNNLLGSSAQISVNVKSASSTSLAITGGTTAGSSVTLAATVSGAGGVPSGTVTFNDGTTSLGTVALENGTASLTSSTLPAGTHSITAIYSGDTTFQGSTSAATSLVLSPDFSISASPTTLAVVAGQSATTNVALAPQPGGFSNPITVSCSGLPSLSACSANPTSVTPGNSAASVKVTITTTAATNAFNRIPVRASRIFLAFSLPGFGLLVIGGYRNRKHILIALSAVVVAMIMLSLVACGGGGGGNGTQPPTTKPGTPAGSYTVTLTATSGTTMHATTVNLTVQ